MRKKYLVLALGFTSLFASAYVSLSSVFVERKYMELEQLSIRKADADKNGWLDIEETRDWYAKMGINRDSFFKDPEFRKTHHDFRYPTSADLERYL